MYPLPLTMVSLRVVSSFSPPWLQSLNSAPGPLDRKDRRRLGREIGVKQPAVSPWSASPRSRKILGHTCVCALRPMKMPRCCRPTPNSPGYLMIWASFPATCASPVWMRKSQPTLHPIVNALWSRDGARGNTTPMIDSATPIPAAPAGITRQRRWPNKATECRLKIDAERKNQVVGCSSTAAVGPVARHVR